MMAIQNNVTKTAGSNEFHLKLLKCTFNKPTGALDYGIKLIKRKTGINNGFAD